MFDSVADAMRAAVYLQQLFDGYNRGRGSAPALGVRIGAAVGEVVFLDGKYDGLVNYEASRVTATADEGQIHCTATMAALGAPAELTVVQLGKDLAADFPDTMVCRIEWSDVARVKMPVSPSIDAVRAATFVGRASQLDTIVAELKSAEARQLNLVLIQGEAGVGKTSLAAEAAAIAKARGVQVWFGRCDREDPPPYQVWEEVFGDHDRVHLFEERDDDSDSGERYRIYVNVEQALREKTSRQPGMIVLDDLSWADRSSLLLLRHLIRHGRGLSCLVLGTCRSAGIDKSEGFIQLGPDLKSGHRTIDLGGLTKDEIAEYVAESDPTAGTDVDAMADFLYQKTGGNALLVAETLSAARGAGVDGGDFGTTPLAPAVTEIVDERLARVGQSTRRVLQIAAVAGREFAVDLVDRVADLGPWEVSQALDDGLAVGLIERDRQRRPGRYAFVHDLFREALLESVGARVNAVHRAIAEVIHQGPDWRTDPSRLVHHLVAAGFAESRRQAVELAQEAARDMSGAKAMALLEQARRAADAGRGLPILEPYERVNLELAYGVAQKRAGSRGAARTLQAAAQAAFADGFDDLLIKAALAGGRGVFAVSGAMDEDRIRILRSALDRNDEADRLTKARLLGQLGAEYTWEDHSKAAKLTEEAVSIARADGDRRTLVRVLLAKFATHWNPSELDVRREVIRELDELLGDLEGEKRWRFAMNSFGFPTALEAGDHDAAVRHLQAMQSLEAELQSLETTGYCRLWESTLATANGDIDRGEALSEEFAALFERIGKPNEAFAWKLGLAYPVHWHRGTLAKLEESFALAAKAAPGLVVLRAALAAIRAQIGKEDEAERMVRDLSPATLRSTVTTIDHLVTLSVLADAESRLRDPDRARWLIRQLTPLRDQFVLDATSYFGSVRRPLAIAHAVSGDLTRADEHFAVALERNQGQGAEPMALRTKVDWARELCASDRADLVDRGEAMAREAAAEAAQRWPGIARDATEIAAGEG